MREDRARRSRFEQIRIELDANANIRRIADHRFILNQSLFLRARPALPYLLLLGFHCFRRSQEELEQTLNVLHRIPIDGHSQAFDVVLSC